LIGAYYQLARFYGGGLSVFSLTLSQLFKGYRHAVDIAKQENAKS